MPVSGTVLSMAGSGARRAKEAARVDLSPRRVDWCRGRLLSPALTQGLARGLSCLDRPAPRGLVALASLLIAPTSPDTRPLAPAGHAGLVAPRRLPNRALCTRTRRPGRRRCPCQGPLVRLGHGRGRVSVPTRRQASRWVACLCSLAPRDKATLTALTLPPAAGTAFLALLHPSPQRPPTGATVPSDGLRYLCAEPNERRTVSHHTVSCPTSLAAPTQNQHLSVELECLTSACGHFPPVSPDQPLPPGSPELRLTRFRKRWRITNGQNPTLWFVWWGQDDSGGMGGQGSAPQAPPGWDSTPARQYPLRLPPNVPTQPIFPFPSPSRIAAAAAAAAAGGAAGGGPVGTPAQARTAPPPPPPGTGSAAAQYGTPQPQQAPGGGGGGGAPTPYAARQQQLAQLVAGAGAGPSSAAASGASGNAALEARQAQFQAQQAAQAQLLAVGAAAGAGAGAARGAPLPGGPGVGAYGTGLQGAAQGPLQAQQQQQQQQQAYLLAQQRQAAHAQAQAVTPSQPPRKPPGSSHGPATAAPSSLVAPAPAPALAPPHAHAYDDALSTDVLDFLTPRQLALHRFATGHELAAALFDSAWTARDVERGVPRAREMREVLGTGGVSRSTGEVRPGHGNGNGVVPGFGAREGPLALWGTAAARIAVRGAMDVEPERAALPLEERRKRLEELLRETEDRIGKMEERHQERIGGRVGKTAA